MCPRIPRMHRSTRRLHHINSVRTITTTRFKRNDNDYKKVGNWPTQRPMHRRSFFNTTPIFGGGVELPCGVSHPVKAHHSGHTLSIITETVSLSVYEPITIHILLGGTVPQFGGGGRPRGSVVLPPESPPY
jgi:hypothetical protein